MVIREYKRESRLHDGVLVNVTGEVFNEQIFPSGDIVYVSVKIENTISKTLMGIAYFKDPMDEKELRASVDDIAANPEPLLFPLYKSVSQN